MIAWLSKLRGEHGYWETSWDDAATVLERLELDESQKKLVEIRWLNEARHYDRRWRGHRARARWFRAVAVVLSATVTALAGLSAPAAVTAAVGGAAAVVAGFDGIWRYSDRWQPLRYTAIQLEAEGWRFLEQTAPYEGSPGQAVKLFLDTVEKIILQRSEEYVAAQTQPHANQ